MKYELELNLAIKNSDPLEFIDVEGYDFASIEVSMLQGSTFDSGVIELKKSNGCNHGRPFSHAAGATLITLGHNELELSDWGTAKYMVPEVTSGSLGAARVLMTIYLTKYDFKLK